jgi:hypothetical protein
MFTTAPSGLDDAELVSVIQFWERVASSAAAAQLAAIAELARRRPRSFVDGGPAGHSDAGDPLVPEISEFAVDEVAAALRLSRPAAGARLHVAVELTRLPTVATALGDGVLDVPKVRAVVDAVAVLDPAVAVAVSQRVLPRAEQQTVGQLRASLSRAVLAADPAAAELRHERAVAGRAITLQPARDGMAELWALLPADAAVAVYGRLDALARRDPCDGRTMDARRADAFVASVLANLAPPEPPAARTSAEPSAQETAGQPVAADWKSGMAAGQPVDVGGSSVVQGVRRVGVGRAPGLTAATVHVTVPVATALGVGDEPGELAGYGPMPASMSRRLADTASWRKVTVDRTTGAVSEIGRTPYTPSAALADLVRIRDATCRFPGCRQPARRCDLDHVVPWPEGPTTAGNLAALCRHHHRLKHQTRWTVRAGPSGDLLWTSPAGHCYPTSPAV